MTNSLYYGDNLEILRQHFPDESVDLIYLDPPFNSNANYNVLFREQSGEESPAQIRAFTDTWSWTQESERVYEREIIHNPRVPEAMKDIVSDYLQFIGRNFMTAYLVMMAPRLVELPRVLKQSGSIYLHCDPTADHHLRKLMDSLFGPVNYRNSVIWKRTSAHSDSRRYGRITDTLLFYSKSDVWTWNQQYVDFDDHYLARFSNEDDDGRRWADEDLTANDSAGSRYTYEYNGVTSDWRVPLATMKRLDAENRLHLTTNGGLSLKRYLDEMPGMPLQSIWDDIPPINSQARERLGYQTQKPLALLERIVKTSSNAGDLVLDPFCGCGTTVTAAEKLGRRWAGIDITHLAVALMKHRLQASFDVIQDRDYDVIGEPVDVGSARALALQDRYQFQYWALSLIGARPRGENRRGADRGIDGVIHFINGPRNSTKRAIVQVKSGRVSVPMIRDLVGTVDRENAEIGLFITLEPPTRPMLEEAVAAGFYHSELWQQDYPRIQIRTIHDLLNGRSFELPPGPSMYGNDQRVKRPEPPQGSFNRPDEIED